ncbi:MAG: hypothetical protein IKN55_09210 [Oscillospiraceae bacterium]|nr:hypothetical protein [Oscillospiraceae bacterium]
MDKNKKLAELFSDEAFIGSLASAGDVETMQKLFADNGVDLTQSEVVEMMESLLKTGVSTGDELNEDELGAVSGGTIRLTTLPMMISPDYMQILHQNQKLIMDALRKIDNLSGGVNQ